MEKIRSLSILEDKIMQDIVWRKKELTSIIFDHDKSSPKTRDLYWRIGIIFIYSHWEGFIKRASLLYLNYIVNQGYKIAELKYNFNVILLQEQKQNFQSKKYETYNSLFEFLNNKNLKFSIIPENVIDTNSNLNYEVLLEILLQLGIDKNAFELKKNYIENLITFRNKIAHGEPIFRTDEIFSLRETKDEILILLELYKTTIINSSSNKSFLGSY